MEKLIQEVGYRLFREKKNLARYEPNTKIFEYHLGKFNAFEEIETILKETSKQSVGK